MDEAEERIEKTEERIQNTEECITAMLKPHTKLEDKLLDLESHLMTYWEEDTPCQPSSRRRRFRSRCSDWRGREWKDERRRGHVKPGESRLTRRSSEPSGEHHWAPRDPKEFSPQPKTVISTVFFFFFYIAMELSAGYLPFLDCFTWDLLFFFEFLFSFAMWLLQVRASPFVQRREILPFRSPRQTQQGRINKPLPRKSHGQGLFYLMFFVMFVVYSLLVLALVFFEYDG